MNPSQKFISRKVKVAGELRAGTLGELQESGRAPKSRRNGWFRFLPETRHEHAWLRGEINRVCSLCGLTETLGG